MNTKDVLLRVSVSTSIALTGVLAAALPAAAADGGGGGGGGGGVTPNPTPQLPDALEGKLNTLLGVMMAIVIFACVAGVLIVAALLAVAARRGSLDDHFGRLGAVGAACILVGGASSFVMFLV